MNGLGEFGDPQKKTKPRIGQMPQVGQTISSANKGKKKGLVLKPC